MFNLNDILQSAQGGEAINNIAQRFGLSPEQAQAAVQALIPALSAGLTKAAANPGHARLGHLGGQRQHAPGLVQRPQRRAIAGTRRRRAAIRCRKFSAQITSSSRSFNVHRRVTGIRPDILMQMLPVIASVVIGGLATSLKNQGLGGMLGQLATAAEQGNLGSVLGGSAGGATAGSSGGGLMSVLTNLLGGLFGGQSAGSGASAAGNSSLGGALNSLTNMFQTGNLPSNISQSGLQDEIGKILGGNR